MYVFAQSVQIGQIAGFQHSENSTNIYLYIIYADVLLLY